MKDQQDNDRALVARVIMAGEARAFGLLYDRHSPYLYKFALRLTGGDEARAQDALHDAWLSAVARFAHFQWRSELRTWLGGFVLHSVRRLSRHDGQHTSLDDRLPLTDGTFIDADVDPLDLERAIEALPAGYRQVLVLHDIEGYTHQEIAELLDIEAGTSKSQLARARAAVRRTLDVSRAWRTS